MKIHHKPQIKQQMTSIKDLQSQATKTMTYINSIKDIQSRIGSLIKTNQNQDMTIEIAKGWIQNFKTDEEKYSNSDSDSDSDYVYSDQEDIDTDGNSGSDSDYEDDHYHYKCHLKVIKPSILVPNPISCLEYEVERKVTQESETSGIKQNL